MLLGIALCGYPLKFQISKFWKVKAMHWLELPGWFWVVAIKFHNICHHTMSQRITFPLIHVTTSFKIIIFLLLLISDIIIDTTVTIIALSSHHIVATSLLHLMRGVKGKSGVAHSLLMSHLYWIYLRPINQPTPVTTSYFRPPKQTETTIFCLLHQPMIRGP